MNQNINLERINIKDHKKQKEIHQVNLKVMNGRESRLVDDTESWSVNGDI